MDGEITIGTRLDTDKFDRQVSDLEKKMKKEEDKKIIIETKLNTQEQDLEKARQKADELADAYQSLKKAQDALDAGNATPAQFTTFQDLQATYGSLEQLGASFDKALSKQDAIEQKVAQTKFRYDEINGKVNEYKQKIENIKIQKQVSDVEKLKQSFNNVGSSIQNTVKHVAKLGLGIFGIRSAFLAIRRASSDLASYDTQYATNLEYIRYVLTQAIAPVLQWIVSLTAKLLSYINAIMQAWFGINLFARGSAENFNKMKAGASGTAKAVKEIKKQLAGFDEITMLTDQSDTGTKSGAGGVGMPSFDLSAMQGEIPPWLKWIIDNKDLILSVLAGIAGGLIAIKLGASGLQGLGIGLMVTGIIYAIQNLLEYLQDPTWQNFGEIIQGIGVAIAGLGIIIGVATGGWVVAIVGAIVLIVGTIVKYWEEIKAFLQSGIDWLTGKSDWVHQMFGDTIGNIYDTFVNILQDMLNAVDLIFQGIKEIFDGFIDFFVGIFTGDFDRILNGLGKIVEGLITTLVGLFRVTWSALLNVLGALGKWIYDVVIQPVINLFSNMWNGIKEGASNAWNWIIGIFGKIGNWFGNIISLIINKFRDMGAAVGTVVSGAFKSVVNAILGAIEGILNTPIRAINGLISVINAVPRN